MAIGLEMSGEIIWYDSEYLDDAAGPFWNDGYTVTTMPADWHLSEAEMVCLFMAAIINCCRVASVDKLRSTC